MKHISFSSWALLFFSFVIFTNIVIYFWGTSYRLNLGDIEYEKAIAYRFLILNLTATFFLIVGFIFTIISVVKKEKKDTKYYINLYGYPAFIIIGIILSFLI